MEINEIENRKTMGKSLKPKVGFFFRKLNKIDKPLAILIKNVFKLVLTSGQNKRLYFKLKSGFDKFIFHCRKHCFELIKVE